MQQKVKLTVFTPAYNRAHTLGRCYESMLKQKCKDFKWLIIDDGSTDNTKELVDSWLNKDNGFEIIYKYKKNGGMHTAHNLAYELIDTELNVCIDSDDRLSENAIEKIIDFWNENGSEKYAGIIGLDDDLDGNIIGPTILGDSTGLSAFWVLFSILLFGGLFGVVGMIVGVPTFAVFYYIVKLFITQRLEKKKLPVETESYNGMNYVDNEGNYVSYIEENEEVKEEKGEE